MEIFLRVCMCVCVCVCVWCGVCVCTCWNYHFEWECVNASVIFFEFLCRIDFGRLYLNIDE